MSLMGVSGMAGLGRKAARLVLGGKLVKPTFPLCRCVNPSSEYANGRGKVERSASNIERVAVHPCDPPTSCLAPLVQVAADLAVFFTRKGSPLHRRVDQVDFERPSRIIERVDLNPVGMLPIIIAL
jgi:hypothetical protein